MAITGQFQIIQARLLVFNRNVGTVEACMSKPVANTISTLLLAAAILFLTACPTRTSIERINRDPGRFLGKEVTIAGRVSNSFGALGAGIFEVEDDTGRMWVYSQRYGVPSSGAKVAVTGTIQQGFSFGGRSFATILRESERRH
jgi:hypothetical protein